MLSNNGDTREIEFDIETHANNSKVPAVKLYRSLIIAILIVMLFYPPVTRKYFAGIVSCPILVRTGYPCPGCGLTRSINAIWHGNLLESIYLHPLGLPLFLGVISLATYEISNFRKADWSTLERKLVKWRMIAMIYAIYISLWAVRLYLAVKGLHSMPDLK